MGFYRTPARDDEAVSSEQQDAGGNEADYDREPPTSQKYNPKGILDNGLGVCRELIPRSYPSGQRRYN